MDPEHQFHLKPCQSWHSCNLSVPISPDTNQTDGTFYQWHPDHVATKKPICNTWPNLPLKASRNQNQQGISCEEYRASPFSTCDTVTVVKQREEKEISNSFYVHIMDLDINDMEKTMNFMVSYGVDQAEYYPYDAVSGSRLFTVDHFRTYHQDLC